MLKIIVYNFVIHVSTTRRNIAVAIYLPASNRVMQADQRLDKAKNRRQNWPAKQRKREGEIERKKKQSDSKAKFQVCWPQTSANKVKSKKLRKHLRGSYRYE